MLPKLISDVACWYQDLQSDPGGMWMEGIQFVTDDKDRKSPSWRLHIEYGGWMSYWYAKRRGPHVIL